MCTESLPRMSTYVTRFSIFSDPSSSLKPSIVKMMAIGYHISVYDVISYYTFICVSPERYEKNGGSRELSTSVEIETDTCQERYNLELS